MAANTNPIFARVGDVQVSQQIANALSLTDGTGTAVTQIFQADTTEGSFVDEIRLKPIGSVAATVIRIFLNSNTAGAYAAGTTNSVATTALIAEISVAAITASTTAAQNDLSIPIRKALPPGFRLLYGVGTAHGAGTGMAVTVFGGKY